MLRTPSEIFWYGFYSLIRYNTKQINTKNHQPGFPGGWNYPPMPYFWTYMPLWGRLLLCSLDPSKELQLLRLSKLKQIMVQKRKSWGNKVTLISWTMIIERMKSLPMLILKTKLSSLTTFLILEICISVTIMAFWLKHFGHVVLLQKLGTWTSKIRRPNARLIQEAAARMAGSMEF